MIYQQQCWSCYDIKSQSSFTTQILQSSTVTLIILTACLLTLLQSERPTLRRVLAVLCAIGLNNCRSRSDCSLQHSLEQSEQGLPCLPTIYQTLTP